MNLGTPELLVILLIVLLVFGGAKLPKLAKSLGQAQKEFKSGLQNGASDDKSPNDKNSNNGNSGDGGKDSKSGDGDKHT